MRGCHRPVPEWRKADVTGTEQSRLDLFIDRMVSQRACLDHAIALTAAMAGPVYELGLGNGRTYHHLAQHIFGRDIFVFERAVASHPDSTPPDDRLVLGDIRETLPATLAGSGPVASLIHADLGGHNREKNDKFARMVSPLVEPHLAPGGLMVSSDRMYFDGLEELQLPPGAVEGRCFIYRRG
ncbi:class I SAM-dependent methyltransferase [Ruegeria sp. WL0004]|uniref:Class I SAM-dependent methyltransferase n=1 Tax=Ruegeria marisflavi TaxID=2984152 RepID=A0ABT2WPB4_9RHOB|nr:class I SAM-dependent methyltransferase [Ruegeria sp. WL0004]